MHSIGQTIRKTLVVMVTCLALVLPTVSYSGSGAVEESPSALAMTGDLLIARPLLLVATAIGTVIFVISSPFSLMGGNFLESGETLVVGPAKATFVRCLGCPNSGYKSNDLD